MVDPVTQGTETELDGDDLPDLIYEAPEGFEWVGFWCHRGRGHTCASSCKSDSVPLFAQVGWAADVRDNIAKLDPA